MFGKNITKNNSDIKIDYKKHLKYFGISILHLFLFILVSLFVTVLINFTHIMSVLGIFFLFFDYYIEAYGNIPYYILLLLGSIIFIFIVSYFSVKILCLFVPANKINIKFHLIYLLIFIFLINVIPILSYYFHSDGMYVGGYLLLKLLDLIFTMFIVSCFTNNYIKKRRK